MKLILPSEAYLEKIDAYRQEMLAVDSSMDGCGPLRRMEAREWLAACRANLRPETTPAGFVPATQFLYVREEDNCLVGMIQVRHALNGFLEKIAGHIGYSVRPSERRRGYARAMLSAALPYCWDQLGLDGVLVCCLEDNEGSRRAILDNGGVYECTVYDPRGQRMVQRYRIDKPRRLLVTGFEPFGGETENASWEAVMVLPARIGPWDLAHVRLPVVFGEAARQAIAAAESMRAQAVLCVGQAGGRKAVTPELVGINLRHAAIADNAGNRPQDQRAVPGGADALFSPLPVRAMAQAIQEAGLPGAVSYSAGAYVCNDLLYTLLHHFRGTDVGVGFIHVPCMTGQGDPALPLPDIVRALTCAIGAM